MDSAIYTYAILIAIISFLGFILENAWLAIRKKCIDNRNMSLPFLLGYGIFITLLYEVLGTPDSISIPAWLGCTRSKNTRNIIYFILTFIIVSIGEIALGTLVEHFCGFDYWNYESLPLHITKYTSIPTSCAFALIITYFMNNCIQPIIDSISCIPPEYLKSVGIILMFLLTWDFIKSFYIMHKTRQLNIRWCIMLKHKRKSPVL